MTEILMFSMKSCPYCRQALEMMKELCAKNARYKEIPVTIIDEVEQPDLADRYDYYFVPTYYVNGKKLHEGVPTKEAVRRVFDAALQG